MENFHVFLGFVWWDPERGAEVPAPAGLTVRVWDRDLLSPDDLLAEGTLDAAGRAALEIHHDQRELPDLYFEVLAPGHPTLPGRWRSLDALTADYGPGLFTDHPGGDLGAPGAPLVFSLTFDCFLRFVYWNPAYQRYMGVPERLVIRAMDRERLGRDRELARALTSPDGRAHLRIPPGGERRPDIYFTLEIPDDRPDRIDPGRALLAPRGELALPRRWSSREAYAMRDPDRRGYWGDRLSYQLGAPDHPYVFDVLDGPSGFSPGHEVEALIDGPAALDALERAIDSARRRIYVEVMFLFDDPGGRAIADRLMARAREGIEVRLLFDPRTTQDVPRHTELRKIWVRSLIALDDDERSAWLARLEATQEADRRRCDLTALLAELRATPNLQLLESSFPYVELDPGSREELSAAHRALEEALPPFMIGRVDHRKFVVIDDALALLGGMNFGQEYLYRRPLDPSLDASEQAAREEDEPWEKWHDCFISIRGPAVSEVLRLFHERWLAEGGDDFGQPPRAGLEVIGGPHGLPVQILDTTPGARLHIHQALIEHIEGAQREIWIAIAYFSSEEIAYHLRAAARRGVAVTCVFPGRRHQDSLDFYYAARSLYEGLLESGARVLEYPNHMSHCKAAIFDDVAMIGSANFNRSSFFNHYELCALVEDAGFAAHLREALFERDLTSCRAVSPAEVDASDINGLASLWLSQVVLPRF